MSKQCFLPFGFCWVLERDLSAEFNLTEFLPWLPAITSCPWMELLRKAEQDGRLGEAMVLHKGPFALNLESMLGSGPTGGFPSGPTIPTPKSVTQKGKAAVATMTAPSSSSGPAGSGSWAVNGRGELVQNSGQEEVVHGSMHEQPQQLPMAPQETSDQVGLRSRPVLLVIHHLRNQ